MEEKFQEAYSDASWENLMDMAGSYEEEPEVEIPAFHNVEFSGDFVDKKHYATPEEALKALFGYDSFRPGQREIIEQILAGRDSFAVMPTGAGKSVCYQIPAVLLPGITLVISPLISLMQDQVKALVEAGIPAAFLNSALEEGEYIDTIRRIRTGMYKIVYVAPERLVTESFLALSREVDISMLTVDEAHCISQWGQDFRPSYRKILEYAEHLAKRPILSAFTATATEEVRADILSMLRLQNPYTVVTGFDRENLFFQVERPRRKEDFVLRYLQEHPEESGIIYCATRKNVDNVYRYLREKGISVGRYHAGMPSEERKRNQDAFVFDDTQIIVATNAFGMGIDKSNVRFVIHYNMPQSMENYYQEAGRAGRDGLDARCILLFSPQDIMIDRFLLAHKVMSELAPSEQALMQERDRQRLRVMERYASTTGCLRNYILAYFGEHPEGDCGSCGNCVKEFETRDLTEEGKQLINCVYELKGRFGRNIVIDTVLGAKTARLKEIGADTLRSYGALRNGNKSILLRLMDTMIAEGYLALGEYQVVRLADIAPLKNPETRLYVKITEEDKQERAPKTKKASLGRTALSDAGMQLFERLRGLRAEIAKEEGMPPYIIFSDRTLLDMAGRVPTTRGAMLAVSGVGEHKYQKYGPRFLACVQACCAELPALASEKPALPGEEPGAAAGKAAGDGKKSGKTEFRLRREEADRFVYQEDRYISEIRDELNRIRDAEAVKLVTFQALREVLYSQALIREEMQAEGAVKLPTAEGERLGIRVIEKQSQAGKRYKNLVYPTAVQRILVERFIEA